MDAPVGAVAPIRADLAAYAVPSGMQSAAASPAGASRSAGPSAPSAVVGLHRQVFGFLPYWELADPTTNLRYDLLSTIAYFSVGVDADGRLQKRNADGTVSTGWAGWTSSRMTSVIEAAHRRHTRVVLTLSMFGWTTGGAARQAALLGDPAARRTLARGAAAAVRARGADGINLDFEPLAAGHEDDFVALVRAIRAQLDALAPGYQLTFDTMGRIGNYPIADATGRGAADAVFVMGYDYRTAGSSNAGSIAPLGGSAYDLTDTVAAYLDEIPASRIILGVPWYGRAWSTVSDALNARTQDDPKYAPSVSVPYADAFGAAAGHDLRWDGRESTAWFAYRRSDCAAAGACVTTWRQLYFEDDRALRLRYDLVNRSGIRGVGIWALGYESARKDAWTAIADKFLRDTTPPEAGIRVLPAVMPDEGFLVDWTAADDYSGVLDYDVEVSIDGGAWRPWRTATTAGADVWLGHDGHAYAFRVRATDRKRNVGAWDTGTTYDPTPALAPGGFGRVLIDGLTARDRPSATAARRATLAAGAIVAITAGPVAAGGSDWYQVTEPVLEWSPVSRVLSGVWIAASGGGATFLAPVSAPNSTRVVAGLTGLSFGGVGATSVGSAVAATSRRAFSPNGDGSQDTLRIDWHARTALEALALRIYGADGSLRGSVALPAAARAAGDGSFAWDGSVGGKVLPDGRYLVQLLGKTAGATWTAPSARPVTAAQLAAYAVTIDTVAPTAGRATISARRISPNGDAVKDAVTVSGSATGATHWSFTVTPAGTATGGAATAPVRAIGGAGPKATVTWDGRADDGTRVADGLYTVAIRNLDWAGNGPRGAWTVLVDTRAPIASVTPTPAVISPNGDGAADRSVLRWASDEGAGGVLEIGQGSRVVRRIVIPSGRSGAAAWDGRSDGGAPVPDGRYRATLRLTDPAGNTGTASATIAVDRTLASSAWSASALDAADGDALAANATLSFRLARSATTSLWIEDTGGTVVRNAWRDRVTPAGTATWTWDGRDGHRAFVADGRYVAVLSVTSPLGTTEVRRPIAVGAFVIGTLPATIAAGSFLTIAFTSTEPLRTVPTVSVASAGGGTSKVTAVRAGPGTYLATVRVGGAGRVSIVIAARDAAGGVNVGRWTIVAQ